MAKLVAELPEDRFWELKAVLEDLDNHQMTLEEANAAFRDLVFPYLKCAPTPDDELTVILKKNVLVQVPK